MALRWTHILMYRLMDEQQHFQTTLWDPCTRHTLRLVVYPVLRRYPLSVGPLQDADEDCDPSRETETPRHTKQSSPLSPLSKIQNPLQIWLPATRTHTHITFSLRPPAIDFQALPISDDQTIDELRSISQPTAPGISAAPCVYVCVLVQLCLWVARWRGCVCFFTHVIPDRCSQGRAPLLYLILAAANWVASHSHVQIQRLRCLQGIIHHKRQQ